MFDQKLLSGVKSLINLTNYQIFCCTDVCRLFGQNGGKGTFINELVYSFLKNCDNVILPVLRSVVRSVCCDFSYFFSSSSRSLLQHLLEG